MKYLLLVAAFLLLASGVAYWRMCACGKQVAPVSGGYAKEEWPAAYKLVRDKFPEVRQLTTAQLDDWLKDKTKPQPLLLDARATQEYAVSRLPNAQPAADETQALAALAQKAKDAPVVVYCSIGYRSSALAQKLKARGFTNVQNLEGSIFKWANEARALQRDSLSVNVVHPFDERWGRLLERARWSFAAH